MAPAGGPTPARTVLAVEDDADTLEMTVLVLEQHGFRVLAAATARDALVIAASNAIDAIVIDVGLPDMDGLDLIRRLRQRNSAHPFRVVAVTGWGMPADVARARKAGCDSVLVKPCLPATLVAILNRLLATEDPAV